jgi:hypothetical protein
MTLDILKSADIIETMEDYIAKVRPHPEIRPELDLGYEISGQSIILNEIRPFWNDPTKIMTTGYAKGTYIKDKDIWEIYWKRADNKWHVYKPFPVVGELKHFLKIVDDDVHCCFKG